MARYKRVERPGVESLEGDALRGFWQVRLRQVFKWILAHGEDAWVNPELRSLSNDLRKVSKPLNLSTSKVDVDEVNAVYDRALSLGFSSRTEI